MEISKLGKGRCILLNERPYRIVDTKSVVISKHSHTRTKLELEDVFSGERVTKNMSPHEHVKDVDVPRKQGQLISKLGDSVQVMDMFTYEIFEAALDKNLEINEGDLVTFVEFNGNAKVIEKRLANS